MARSRDVLRVTIPNGGTTSDVANVAHRSIVGVIAPAGWTTGDLSFTALVRQAAGNPVTPTFGAVFNDAGTPAAIKLTGLAVDTYYNLTTPIRAPGQVKAVSSVSQGADRVIGLVCIDET